MCFFGFHCQSDDCTVFFFSVGERFKPIGFIETASPVVSLEWSKKRKVRILFELWISVYYSAALLFERRGWKAGCHSIREFPWTIKMSGVTNWKSSVPLATTHFSLAN